RHRFQPAAFLVPPGGLHGAVYSIGQHGAVLRRAIIVLSRRDVPAATAGVDLQRVGILRLTTGARLADKIGRDTSSPVGAHRVRRITMQRQDGLLPTPET